MTIREEQRDLFTLPHGYTLAHCISEDFALGAGIAVEFNGRYDMRRRLRRTKEQLVESLLIDGVTDYDFVGNMIPIDNVVNLITKKYACGKPTYEDLTDALYMMSAYVVAQGIKRIGMPRIGCGLDGLNWDEVKSIIEECFEDIDVEIVICYL